MKKANKKKKDYTDQDVNGFLEFLQQRGQTPPTTTSGQQELRQEVEVALKKDHRRENRRVKRQTDKKSKMVRELTKEHVCIFVTKGRLLPKMKHFLYFHISCKENSGEVDAS